MDGSARTAARAVAARAGERNHVDERGVRERGAHGLAGSVDEVDDAGREADLCTFGRHSSG